MGGWQAEAAAARVEEWLIAGRGDGKDGLEVWHTPKEGHGGWTRASTDMEGSNQARATEG